MLDEIDKLIIRILGEDLPLTSVPYTASAAKIGMEAGEFLQRLTRLREVGVLRRVGLVLRHRELGYAANAMCVWQVAPERLDEAGELLSARQEVSHCYSRIPSLEWPYNLYAMIHAHSREDCAAVADKLARQVESTDYQILYSTREWKKTTMLYFDGGGEK